MPTVHVHPPLLPEISASLQEDAAFQSCAMPTNVQANSIVQPPIQPRSSLL
jgi:hypothetical protein